MKTADEILNENFKIWDYHSLSSAGYQKWIVDAVNQARKEAIEECANRAETEYYFSEFDDKVVLETIKVDRSSILSLLNEIK